ncbi:MAG: glycosyltransferase family 4 protein [Actinobacteria bacterium]|nr:glycosyltransferase family 4 protein [Actinomycetota bacterium]
MTLSGEKYRLLLDARGLAGRVSGMGRYVTRLATGLKALQPDDFALSLLCLPEDNPPLGIPAHVLSGLYAGARPNTVKQHLIMPPKLAKLHHGIYHYPSFDMPFNRSPNIVVTCPDLEPLVNPKLFTRKIVLYYRFFFRRLRYLKNMIAISQKTAADLVEIVGIDKNKISVIYLGVDESFLPITEERILGDLRRRYELPDDYMLYVGNTMPHKNLARLILAFARIQPAFPEVHLVIAGAADQYRENIKKVVLENNLANKVIFLDSIPEKDLPVLYSSCRLFTFPSLYEGFGLPALEAMACGAPVLASTAGSLPEVVGDAGILVDPFDVDGISDGISRVLADSNLANRLSGAGIRQAAGFTWENCARSHLSLYRQMLKRKFNIT